MIKKQLSINDSLRFLNRRVNRQNRQILLDEMRSAGLHLVVENLEGEKLEGSFSCNQLHEITSNPEKMFEFMDYIELADFRKTTKKVPMTSYVSLNMCCIYQSDLVKLVEKITASEVDDLITFDDSSNTITYEGEDYNATASQFIVVKHMYAEYKSGNYQYFNNDEVFAIKGINSKQFGGHISKMFNKELSDALFDKPRGKGWRLKICTQS